MSILTKQQYIATMVIITICITRVATDIYTPILPIISDFFNVPGDLVQSSVAAGFLGSAFVALFAGIFADYFGKRPILIVSVCLFAIGAFICALSSNAYMLIGGRFIQGIGIGAMAIMAHATIQDHFSVKDSAKVRSIMGLFVSISLTFAPIIGSKLEYHFDWRAPFIFVTVCATILFFYMFRKLTEKPFRDRQLKDFRIDKAIRTYKKIAINKEYLRQSAIYPIMLGNVWCYTTLLPYYFEDKIGMTTSEYSYFQATVTVIAGLGPIISHILVGRMSLHNTTILGISSGIVGAITLLLAGLFSPHNTILIGAGIVFYILGTILVFAPTVTLALQIFPKSRNSASALRNMLRMILSFAGGMVASILDDHNIIPLSIYMIITTTIALLIFISGSSEKLEAKLNLQLRNNKNN